MALKCKTKKSGRNVFGLSIFTRSTYIVRTPALERSVISVEEDELKPAVLDHNPGFIRFPYAVLIPNHLLRIKLMHICSDEHNCTEIFICLYDKHIIYDHVLPICVTFSGNRWTTLYFVIDLGTSFVTEWTVCWPISLTRNCIMIFFCGRSFNIIHNVICYH